MMIFGLYLDVWLYAFLWFWLMVCVYVWAGWAYENEVMPMSTVIFITMVITAVSTFGYNFF